MGDNCGRMWFARFGTRVTCAAAASLPPLLSQWYAYVAHCEESKRTAIGIDLGTTFSCVGVWKDDGVVIIPNAEGNRTTPSMVAFTDTERLVGDSARSQITRNATNTVYDAKRLIGRRADDPTVKEDAKRWPFRVVAGPDGKAMVEVQYKGLTKSMHPEQVSALVLAKIKQDAEAFMGCDISDAVITVPAYFNDAQ